MSEFNTPLSNTEAILQNFLGAENELKDPQSNIEAMLMNELGGDWPEREPQSRVEKLVKEVLEGVEPHPTLINKSITENGIYDPHNDNADGYKKVSVAVAPNVGSKQITQNGTYRASEDGYDGYSEVTVDTPSELTTKTITENGTYQASSDNVDGYSSVEVTVAPPENSFVLTTKKDDIVDISDAADIPVVDLKADVSSADEVMVGVGDGENFIADNAPYLFRPTLNHTAEVKEMKEVLVGASMAHNQIIPLDASKWVTYITSLTLNQNNEYEIKSNANTSTIKSAVIGQGIPNHVYYLRAKLKNDDSSTILAFGFYENHGGTAIYRLDTNSVDSFEFKEGIYKESSVHEIVLRLQLGTQAGIGGKAKDLQLFDLTLDFGNQIADYAYTLEQSEAGSGIAWLKANGFFGEEYYPYNAGGIQSVKTSAKKVTGFNQWDEEYTLGNNRLISNNHIPVIAGATYYFKSPLKMYVTYYDANKLEILSPEYISANTTKTIPNGVNYIKFSIGSSTTPVTTYNHDICINFHWDGERDGEYEPYEEHTYPLGNDELRGLYKLSNGKIVANGDVKTSDGQIARRYGIVDLGSLDNWRYSNGVMINESIGGKTRGEEFVSTSIYGNSGLSPSGDMPDKTMQILTNAVWIKDSTYTDPDIFKTAMSGKYLVYEKATHTTETADPYTNPQIVDNWGTEEYVDERDVPVPVGHKSDYFDGDIYFSYIYDANGDRASATGTADLITGEVTGGNHCDTFVVKPSGDNVVASDGEVEVKYLTPLTEI